MPFYYESALNNIKQDICVEDKTLFLKEHGANIDGCYTLSIYGKNVPQYNMALPIIINNIRFATTNRYQFDLALRVINLICYYNNPNYGLNSTEEYLRIISTKKIVKKIKTDEENHDTKNNRYARSLRNMGEMAIFYDIAKFNLNNLDYQIKNDIPVTFKITYDHLRGAGININTFVNALTNKDNNLIPCEFTLKRGNESAKYCNNLFTAIENIKEERCIKVLMNLDMQIFFNRYMKQYKGRHLICNAPAFESLHNIYSKRLYLMLMEKHDAGINYVEKGFIEFPRTIVRYQGYLHNNKVDLGYFKYLWYVPSYYTDKQFKEHILENAIKELNKKTEFNIKARYIRKKNEKTNSKKCYYYFDYDLIYFTDISKSTTLEVEVNCHNSRVFTKIFNEDEWQIVENK